MPQIKSTKREMLEAINVSGGKVRFEIARNAGEEPDVYELAPDEIVELDANYVRQFESAPGRDPRPSTISLLTNKQVLPVTHPEAKAAYDRAVAAREAAAKPAPKKS